MLSARAELDRALDDVALLRDTVNKLVEQLNRLSLRELEMVDRDTLKQLVLDLCSGVDDARLTALREVDKICSFNEAEQRHVGLIASSWFGGLTRGAAARDNADSVHNADVASQFVEFLENAVLEEDVLELQQQEADDQPRGQENVI